MFYVPKISIELHKRDKRGTWCKRISYLFQRREKMLRRLSVWPVTKNKSAFLNCFNFENILVVM